jgi:hypothetical protein
VARRNRYGGALLHAPPRFARKMVGSAQLLLLFSADGTDHCHLQKEHKRNNKLSPFLLGFWF